MLPLLEPPLEVVFKRKANLPAIDRILDYCKNRQDFPKEILSAQGIPGQPLKRRRSIVREFLCSTNESRFKRRRAFSMDENTGFKVLSWYNSYQTQPKVAPTGRRHSMFEHNSPDILVPNFKKGIIRPWSVDEDNCLLEAVKTYGAQWTKISNIIPGRNRRQCKEHWFRVLSKRPCARGVGPAEIQGDDQDVEDGLYDSAESRRGLWSHDEDAQLLRAYTEFGPRWPLIASRVHGRNQRQCEKRYRRIRKSHDEAVEQSTEVLLALSNSCN